MPDPTPAPVPTIVQTVTAFFDGLAKVLPVLRDSVLQILTAVAAITSVFFAQQSHNASTQNAAKIDQVTAKVDESARLMTGLPPMMGQKPKP